VQRKIDACEPLGQTTLPGAMVSSSTQT